MDNCPTLGLPFDPTLAALAGEKMAVRCPSTGSATAFRMIALLNYLQPYAPRTNLPLARYPIFLFSFKVVLGRIEEPLTPIS